VGAIHYIMRFLVIIDALHFGEWNVTCSVVFRGVYDTHQQVIKSANTG